VVPVSNGESIFTASANAAQEPEVNYFGFFRYPHGIHKRSAVIRIGRWLSTGLFTTSPQATWCHRGKVGSRRRIRDVQFVNFRHGRILAQDSRRGTGRETTGRSQSTRAVRGSTAARLRQKHGQVAASLFYWRLLMPGSERDAEWEVLGGSPGAVVGDLQAAARLFRQHGHGLAQAARQDQRAVGGLIEACAGTAARPRWRSAAGALVRQCVWGFDAACLSEASNAGSGPTTCRRSLSQYASSG
jgi:hypothetical protein